MMFYFRDRDTGMQRGYIRWPDGKPPQPSGCRWCGIVENGHGRRWVPSRKWHHWTPPTNAQIMARVRSRTKTEENE